jgi:hypothetical protein
MPAMVRDVFQERCSQILAVAPELLAYQRWLDAERAKPRVRDYLFVEAQPRFEPRKEDVVVPLPGLRVECRKGACALRGETLGVVLELPGIKAADAERVLASLDGQRSLLEARWHAGVASSTLAQFLRLTFGRVTFAPQAVAALEAAISGTEITRFPCAAYAIERAYWGNMADVRAHAESAADLLEGTATFERRLREMHVLALMGRSLGSYYKPASPVADEVVAPGALYLDAARLLEGAEGTVFLDGPRVNVSLVGGEGYHRALYASLGDEEALAPQRSFEADGLSWGRYVMARSDRDDRAGAWFCPPRPVREGHLLAMLERLRSAHAAARTGNATEAVRQVARFHQAFVRLHPFYCANQSLAMNLANVVVGRVAGGGIPHLMLDHLALRLSERAYERVFARATRAFALSSQDPAARLATLLERKNLSFGIIEKLGKAATESEADAIVRANPEAARFALVRGASA